MRTNKARSQFDCLDKLESGEPYFILRPQDRLAAEHVEAWAIETELNGCPPEKVKDACRIAAARYGLQWRKLRDRHKPCRTLVDQVRP